MNEVSPQISVRVKKSKVELTCLVVRGCVFCFINIKKESDPE